MDPTRTPFENIVDAMMDCERPSDYWRTEDNINIVELVATKNIIQRNGESVFEHTMKVIDLLPIKNSITLMAGLMHDIGKAVSEQDTMGALVHANRISRFPGHEIKSADIAKDLLTVLGADQNSADQIIRIVRTHMYDLRFSESSIKNKTLRKFIADIGINNIDNWFSVRIADSMSYSSTDGYVNKYIISFRKNIKNFIDNEILSGNFSDINTQASVGFEIDGRDV